MTLSRREMLQTGAIAALLPFGADSGAQKRKILIAGGHPDDPESACGGTASLFAAAGHEVVHLYLTRGEAGIPGKSHEDAAAIRTREAEAASSIVGARPIFADQIDGATEITPARYDFIRAILEHEAPGLVFTHWPIDSHRDHRAISLLVYDAWLRLSRKFALFYFEVESGAQTQHFHPTHYVDITQVEPQKREACYAHKSQKPDDFYGKHHAAMHAFRGREAGYNLAEAFVRHNQNRGELL